MDGPRLNTRAVGGNNLQEAEGSGRNLQSEGSGRKQEQSAGRKGGKGWKPHPGPLTKHHVREHSVHRRNAVTPPFLKTSAHAHAPVHPSTCANPSAHMGANTHTHTCTHTQSHTPEHTHTHTHTHTWMHEPTVPRLPDTSHTSSSPVMVPVMRTSGLMKQALMTSDTCHARTPGI